MVVECVPETEIVADALPERVPDSVPETVPDTLADPDTV